MSGGAYAGFYREEAVAVLLKHGAKVNCVSEHGLTPLNRAAEQGEELVRALVEHGADLSLGKRPAIFDDAIACLKVGVVRVLLEAGIDPNGPNTLASRNKSSRNHCRHTAEGHHQFPLEAAYCMMDLGDYQRTRDIVQLLVDYGADVTLPLDKDGTTMLHSFARDGQSLEPFLAQGVDIEQQDSNGCTPLLLATRCQREIPLTQPTESDDTDTLPRVTTAAEQLINAGANLEAVDKAGKTVLHHLMGRNHVPCKRAFAKLIDKGADINARDNKNATPLLTYLRHHCGDCIEDLISAGSDLLAVDNQGNSTFHTLARHLPSQRYTEFMKAFIAAGVSPNARNLAGNTPLFPFILSSTPSTPLHSWSDGTPTYHRDSVNLLIDAGCDVFATNNKGEGLLHYAARMDQGDTMGYGESRKKEIVDTFQMLMERGLDPRMEDVEGKTPLDIAAACENKGILKLFEREE